jgi:predicted hotdog family 3-hydroxylacyl-ACP dehydratase
MSKPDLTPPIEAERVLPHRPPMLLLERLTACAESAATAAACLAPGGLFAAPDGRLDPVVMIELIAQTYAALRGYNDLIADRPVRDGLLVGAREVRLLAPARAGESLRVEVRTAGLFEDRKSVV